MTNWLDQYDQNPVETRNKYLNLGYGQGLLFCRCFCSSGCHVQGWIISWWTPVMDENVFSSLWHFNRCSAIYKPISSLLNHSSPSLLNTWCQHIVISGIEWQIFANIFLTIFASLFHFLFICINLALPLAYVRTKIHKLILSGHKYFRLAKICHVVMRWIPRFNGI